ncbi:transcription elongation factor b polypeptide 1 [Stemphylium lycopersici]|nr:transcription elongation factor b polypeptide 1 [Stemphylium lycopersici]
MADNEATEYVTLVSNDGYEFKLLRSAACIAGTIKKALDPMCTIPATNQTYGVVLEKVCEYLYYNQKHAESKDVSDMDIPPELCLELLIAADYLDAESLSPAPRTAKRPNR